MELASTARALNLARHPLSPLLLHAGVEQGGEVFAGRLDDPALSGLAALAPNSRDLAEAVGHADPARFLRRRAITRNLLAQRLGCDAASVEIGHDPRGAPQLLSRAAPALYLSLSARKNLFAFAFAPHHIGIDLEPIDEPFEPPWNVLGEADCARLAALADPARHLAFLQIWTAREAFLKAMGVGFMGAGDVLPDGGNRLWQAKAAIGFTSFVLACAELPGKSWTISTSCHIL